MAQYTITHACEHQQTHVLYGKIEDRHRKLDRWKEGVCTTCYRESLSKRAIFLATQLGLPALTGSTKQIAWAESLRGTRVDDIREFVNTAIKGSLHDVRGLRMKPPPQAQQRVCDNAINALVNLLRDKVSSSWWIDTRDRRVACLLGDLLAETHGTEGKEPAEWLHGMLTQGRTMTPRASLILWYDVLTVLDYVLGKPSSNLVAGALTALREAFEGAPETIPAVDDLRFVPVIVGRGEAHMLPLKRTQTLTGLLSAMADLTSVVPNCDADAVRSAANSLAVALRMTEPSAEAA